MPHARNDGVRIRYEVAGDGLPLVVHPGFTQSLEDWADAGYVDALRADYRLVLLDPRGQGQSDAPHEPAAYTRRQRVGDVLAVLDAAGIERAHFWGYSMGGYVAYALGVLAPDRAGSLVIGGADPFRGTPGRSRATRSSRSWGRGWPRWRQSGRPGSRTSGRRSGSGSGSWPPMPRR